MNPRETMRVLPRWLQPFLTWLTGKPLGDGTSPMDAMPWKTTPLSYLLTTLGLMAVGEAVLLGILQYGISDPIRVLLMLPLLLYALLVISGAARVLYIVIIHHGIHGTFMSSHLGNRITVEAISLALLLSPWQQFYRAHVVSHHGIELATLKDGDVQMLLSLGLRPGQSRRAFWQTLWRSLFSLQFHARFLARRLYWNFLDPKTPLWRKALAYALHGGALFTMIGFAWAFDSFLPPLWYFVGYMVPFIPLWQDSALLQWASEHLWLRKEDEPGIPYRVRLARLTNGRFIGDPVPPHPMTALVFLQWIWWWLRLLFLHLPTRLWVLVGDLPGHDAHHRRKHDWTRTLYLRTQFALNRRENEEPWQEVWGQTAMINQVADVFAALPPLTPEEISRLRHEAISDRKNEPDSTLAGM